MGVFDTGPGKIKPYEKMIIASVLQFMKDKLKFDAKITVRKKKI